MPQDAKRNSCNRVDSWESKTRPGLGVKVCNHDQQHSIELYLKIKPYLGFEF